MSLVTLGVGNLSRSIAFYEALGWRRSMREAQGVAFFQLGGIGLSLFPVESLAEDAGRPLPPPGTASITLAHNCREKAGVDAVIARFAEAGGTVVKPGHDAFWGGYTGYAADPDGYLWEIAWNPGFPIDDGGSITLPD